jgi:hypothetical protein
LASKFGQCPLCPKGRDVRLYGEGVCSYHYVHADVDLSKAVTIDQVRKVQVQSREEMLLKFWIDQAAQMPRYCENGCKRTLPTASSAAWVIKASIAHIVEKRNFESVIVHPMNRWFACKWCHTNYDDRGYSFQVTMPVWPLIVDRFKLFMEFIKPEERQFLNPQLWELLDKAHPLC